MNDTIKERIKELESKAAILNTEIIALKKLAGNKMADIEGKITFSVSGTSGDIKGRSNGIHKECSICLHPLFDWEIVKDDQNIQCLIATRW